MVPLGGRGWTGSQEETASLERPESRENLPETPSKAIADQVGIPVLPVSQGRGVPRVSQALVVQERLERRVARDCQAFQDRPEHPVSKVSQDKV